MPVMHPDIGEGFACRGLALRDLVFMMRKLKIQPATMNIEMIAQAAGRHGRALDMPARPANPPGRRPARLIRFSRFPEHEIERIALSLADLDTGTSSQIFELLARQLAVTLEF